MTFSIWKMISHPLCFAPDCPSSLTFPVLTHYKQTSTYLYQLIQTESTHLAPGTHPFLACSTTITSPPKNSHHPQEASTHPHPPIEHLQQVSTAVHAQVCHRCHLNMAKHNPSSEHTLFKQQHVPSIIKYTVILPIFILQDWWYRCAPSQFIAWKSWKDQVPCQSIDSKQCHPIRTPRLLNNPGKEEGDNCHLDN